MFETEVGNVNADMAKAAAGVTTLAQVAGQQVDDLQKQLANEVAIAADMQTHLDDNQKYIAQLQAQLAALPLTTKVYDRLEYLQPSINTNPIVGGSGGATGGWKAPGIECAEMWILDNPTSAAPNYGDDYETWKFTPDGTKTHLRLEGGFLFPTAADIAACQCLEFEARQVTDDLKMVILAGQLQYSGGNLRYFDWSKRAWLPFGVAIQRPAPQTWVTVAVEGHRDATTVYYDALELNGVRHAMTQSYPLALYTWQPRLSASLQLDDNSAVNGFRVKIDDWKLTVGQ